MCADVVWAQLGSTDYKSQDWHRDLVSLGVTGKYLVHVDLMIISKKQAERHFLCQSRIIRGQVERHKVS